MNSPLIFFVVAVIVVGVLLFWAISVTKKKVVVLDVEKYQTRWLAIEQDLSKGEEATYKIAVLEADKLVDKALMELGVPGNNMGDRLKQAGNSKFSSINSIWHAHKLRNQIAHEPGFTINYDQAVRALASFKQGLRDLGAI